MAFSSFGGSDRTKAAWLLILIGIACNAIAETVYAVQDLILRYDMNEFFPSYADPFWLAGYLGLQGHPDVGVRVFGCQGRNLGQQGSVR